MNPELTRLLWLEFTPSRVASVLIALFAVLGLGWLIDDQTIGVRTASFALAAFAIFTVAWGANQVGQSLLEEIRGRTWDQQRMSALSPWTMTWGKLAGASAMAWLAGLIALAAYAIGGAHDVDLPWKLLLLIGGAVLIHGMSLFGALLLLQRGPAGRSSMVLRLVGGLVVAWAALAFVRRETGLIEWFGTTYPLLPFTAVVVCLLAAWIVYGSERLMCEELQLRTLPFALFAFLVFGTGLAAGFVVDAGMAPATRALLTAACGLGVALVTAYFSAFALRGDPLLPRRVAVDARRRDWARVGAALPVWLVSLAYAGVCAVIARLAFANVDLPTPLDLWFRAPAGALPIFLYAVRDMVVLFGLGCTVRAGRTELVSLIYLALVYWLLPGILTLAGAGAPGRLLTPMPWIRPDEAVLILLVHIGLAVAYARFAYLKRVQPLTAAAGSRS